MNLAVALAGSLRPAGPSSRRGRGYRGGEKAMETDVLGHIRSRLTRAKRDGQPFAAAWHEAIATLPAGGDELPDVLSALVHTHDSWRRAFVDEPATTGETAAAALAHALSGSERDEAVKVLS